MLKEHLRVKMAMNAGRNIRRVANTPGSGKVVLWVILIWVGMIALTIIAKKFNMM
jgi:hypothetical protein